MPGLPYAIPQVFKATPTPVEIHSPGFHIQEGWNPIYYWTLNPLSLIYSPLPYPIPPALPTLPGVCFTFWSLTSDLPKLLTSQIKQMTLLCPDPGCFIIPLPKNRFIFIAFSFRSFVSLPNQGTITVQIEMRNMMRTWTLQCRSIQIIFPLHCSS